MTLIDILVLGAVLLLLAAAIWVALRRRKAGKTCGGGCAGCPQAGKCAGGVTPGKPGGRPPN